MQHTLLKPIFALIKMISTPFLRGLFTVNPTNKKNTTRSVYIVMYRNRTYKKVGLKLL